MKIFVTGGAGFIGKHLVKTLLKGKNEIIIYENFSNSSKIKLQEIKNDVEIIEGDLTNFDLLKNYLKDVDNVIHLAANIDILESIKHPEKSHKINVIGSMNLLRASVINDVSGIIGFHIPWNRARPSITVSGFRIKPRLPAHYGIPVGSNRRIGHRNNVPLIGRYSLPAPAN